VLDALMFEERGIPGVALITAPFHQTAAAMASTWGLPGFKFLEMPHPVANLSEEQMAERAGALATPTDALLRG
jgi:hypothetical protein